ncbi:MAG: hypothetical protein NC548_49345 [Lachnospiraceae bacterium]|nr:hypothetical protein [Lachnospiraceae bacterium]
MLKNGFVKIHRSLLDWEWYNDIPTKTLFIHLILTVSINDSRWQGIEVKRGSRVSSLDILSNETGLTTRQLRTAIKHLEMTGELTRYKYPKFTVFSVNNFDKFQEVAVDRQSADNLTTSERQQYKKIKEDKEDKEVVRSPQNGKTEQVFELFSSICKSFEQPTRTGLIINQTERLLQQYSLEQFETVFKKAEGSNYLKGKNNNNWKADFEWITKDDKFEKILTGFYDDWKSGKANNKLNALPENDDNADMNMQIDGLMNMLTVSNVD